MHDVLGDTGNLLVFLFLPDMQNMFIIAQDHFLLWEISIL